MRVGESLATPVHQFSAEHLVVLALTAAAITVRATDGTWEWGFDLPLHLSDVVSLLAPDLHQTVPSAREAVAGEPARPDPWPVYIVVAAAIALILFAVLGRLARSPRC